MLTIFCHFFEPLRQIDQMRSILAEYARGNTQSVQILARAHDMRYQAKVNTNKHISYLKCYLGLPLKKSMELQSTIMYIDRC